MSGAEVKSLVVDTLFKLREIAWNWGGLLGNNNASSATEAVDHIRTCVVMTDFEYQELRVAIDAVMAYGVACERSVRACGGKTPSGGAVAATKMAEACKKLDASRVAS